MNKLFKSLCVAAGLFGAMSVMADTAGNVEAGKAKTAVCAGCHGMDGNSAAPNFPKLAGQGAEYLVKQLKDIKGKEGEGSARTVVEMTGLLDALTDQDINDIAAFYSSQKMSLGQANAELVKVGAPLYRAGNMANKVAACAACHGPTGAGIALAKYPALGGQHADYIAAQLHKFRKGERTNDGDTRIMLAIAAKMSDDEIKAVASYISGLD